MNLLIDILIVYGISAIITLGKIFEPVRDFAEKHSPQFWKYLISCMQCLPFWIGIFVSFVLNEPIKVENENLPNFLNVFFTYLFSGCLFSGTTMLIHTVFVKLKGIKWDELQKEETARKIKKGIISKN